MPDFYERLGVRTLVNAHGTLTRLGGTLMSAGVVSAMQQAAQHWVDLPELLVRSGEHVAKLLGVEAALISSGAAAGLALATAACVAGDDPAMIQMLPHLPGAALRRQVLMHKSHRNGYDQAVRQAGVELVEFGWIKETHAWQMEAAINEHTAAVAYFVEFSEFGSLPLSEVISIAHRRDVPVIVDAAAEIPPIANLHRFCDLGADLVIFSGGKDIGGPQSSGLIAGRRDLIDKCRLNASPHYSLGRAMKVGKEEIAGLVTALEEYLAQDEAAEIARWEGQVAYLMRAIGAVPQVCARRIMLSGPGIRPVTIPRAGITWDAIELRITAAEAVQELLDGEPAVCVGLAGHELLLNPQTLRAGEEAIVARRIAEVLGRPTPEANSRSSL